MVNEYKQLQGNNYNQLIYDFDSNDQESDDKNTNIQYNFVLC